MTKILSVMNDVVWGAPALVLILGVGLFLTLKLGFAQIVFFPRACKSFCTQLRSGGKGGSSSFQALCTALAATVGTGNLVGVAGAICLGGPGAVFWMWICGLLGMVTKYAEAVLAVRFREAVGQGYAGGPMYMITNGLGAHFRPLACVYCLLGVAASFGVGCAAQVEAVIAGVNGLVLCWGGEHRIFRDLLVGILLAALVGTLVFGGAKRIGTAAERLVPLAAAGYILLCLGVLAVNVRKLPEVFCSILFGAFSPRAVTGGMLGSAFQALRVGCSRGVFTNEAGMGTASIAHGAADVSHPAEQGLMGILEVFLDTIVICTLTALVILVSGVPISYGTDAGGELTTQAFATVYGSGAVVFLSAALVLFAVATILGWGLYGTRCAEFLFGPKAWRYFPVAQIIAVVLSSVLDGGLIWQASEILNGLMVIPNLIALAALAPEAARLTKEYRKSG